MSNKKQKKNVTNKNKPNKLTNSANINSTPSRSKSVLEREESKDAFTKYEKSFRVIEIIAVVLTLFFTGLTYCNLVEFNNKFTKLDVAKFIEISEPIIPMENTFYTTSGFTIQDITNKISGQPKRVRIGAVVHKTEELLESVVNLKSIKDMPVKTAVVLDLSPMDSKGILIGNSVLTNDALKTNENHILLYFGNKPNVPLIHIVIEGFNEEVEIITYILYTQTNENEQVYLKGTPISNDDLYNLDLLLKVFKEINFDTDLIWKNLEHDSIFDDFYNKIMNERLLILEKINLIK